MIIHQVSAHQMAQLATITLKEFSSIYHHSYEKKDAPEYLSELQEFYSEYIHKHGETLDLTLSPESFRKQGFLKKQKRSTQY